MKMQRTLSIRMGKEDYEFVKRMAEENKEEISKAVRQLVNQGRVMHSIELYKNGDASLGKAAEIAGVSISKMMDILAAFGVKSGVTYEDYAEGLKNLRKVW